MRWRLLVAVLLPLALSGCAKCPDYGPYAVWADPDLYRHLTGRLPDQWGRISVPDPDVVALGGLDPAYGQLGRLDAIEVTSLWGEVGVLQVRQDLPGGISLLLANDHDLFVQPLRAPITDAQAYAFLAAVMDEPVEVLVDWSARLSSSGYLRICEVGTGSCTGEGDVRSRHEVPAWRLRLAAFFEGQRPWTTAPAEPQPDEDERWTGFESGASLLSDGWTVTLGLAHLRVEGTVGDKPFDLRVAADGVTEFHLANQPWGKKQDPKPTMAGLDPLGQQVLRSLGWNEGLGPDVKKGPGAFSVLCVY